jgi:hypothetical protein
MCKDAINRVSVIKIPELVEGLNIAITRCEAPGFTYHIKTNPEFIEG